MRRLELSRAGKWYIGLTIIVGIVAIQSGNNIIFLMESLLLSAMILSGVLSEKSVRYAKLRRYLGSSSVGEICKDRIFVENTGYLPLFCLEIGEWKKNKFNPIAFIPMLLRGEKVIVDSRQVLGERGLHSWDGIAIATNYPFGFAKKIRIVKKSGERIVWPKKNTVALARKNYFLKNEEENGELRVMIEGDDPRSIVWTLSAKKQEYIIRTRKNQEKPLELHLDLKKIPLAQVESAISSAATIFYEQTNELQKEACILYLRDELGQKKITRKDEALNALALARKYA